LQLSSRLRAFLRRSIPSVEHVEMLVLLRADPSRSWSAGEVAEELRRSAQSAAARLRELQRSKLAVRYEDGRYAYLAGEDDDVVAELEREYSVRRVRLIESIYAPGGDPARFFADAFRLWEDDGDS
jgi:hypothetical protein